MAVCCLTEFNKFKNKLYHKFRKIVSVYSENSYKFYDQVIQKTLMAVEKQCYHELLIGNKENMKKARAL